MTSGENAAKALPGYKKALSGGYLPHLFDAPAAAPPTAGLPWTVGGYEYDPLIEDRPTPPPPQPDRYIKTLGKCEGCGASFGFSENPDRAKCPQCGEAGRIVTGLTAPGTPWF